MADDCFDLHEMAAEWHMDCAAAFQCQKVIYRRPGVGQIDELSATFGATRNVVENDHGIHIDIRYRDFVVRRMDLTIDGNVQEPQPGDEIEFTNSSGVQLIYDVTNQGGESAWDEFDRYGHRIRIHTELCRYVSPGGTPLRVKK